MTYVILQAGTIVAHEFVHSTTAWLLGYMPSPLSIVWGNPVTLLQQPAMAGRKWLFHTLYWFVVVNLMELISYVVMRPFAAGGDTFHFNHGLALSPWLLFIVGTLLVLVALTVLFTKSCPSCAMSLRREIVSRIGRSY